MKTITLTDEESAMLENIMHHSGNNGNGWYHTEGKKALYLLDSGLLKQLQKTHRSLLEKAISLEEIEV